MASKKTNKTTETNEHKALMRMLNNLMDNAKAGHIRAIVVCVDLDDEGIYPNDGKADPTAGGYTGACDLTLSPANTKKDNDNVGIRCSPSTRGLAVMIKQRLIDKAGGLFG